MKCTFYPPPTFALCLFRADAQMRRPSPGSKLHLFLSFLLLFEFECKLVLTPFLFLSVCVCVRACIYLCRPGDSCHRSLRHGYRQGWCPLCFPPLRVKVVGQPLPGGGPGRSWRTSCGGYRFLSTGGHFQTQWSCLQWTNRLVMWSSLQWTNRLVRTALRSDFKVYGVVSWISFPVEQCLLSLFAW